MWLKKCTNRTWCDGVAPDRAQVHQELCRRNVTVTVLHEDSATALDNAAVCVKQWVV